MFTDPFSLYSPHPGFLSEIDSTVKDDNPSDHSAYRSHKQALEMYAFLLQWFVTAAEKGAATKAAAEAPGLKKVSLKYA